MQYTITVKTQAKQNFVEQTGEGSLIVHITTVPQQGKANKKVIELVAKFLHLPKWKLHLVAGLKSPYKIIKVI